MSLQTHKLMQILFDMCKSMQNEVEFRMKSIPMTISALDPVRNRPREQVAC
jgi:hypothetical protein